MEKCHMTMLHIIVAYQDVTRLYHMMMSHNKCGKVVHRPCSSCISSIQNPIGTPLSSFC